MQVARECAAVLRGDDMADLPDTDDKRLFLLLLRNTELSVDEACTVVQEIQNMAAANLIARFEAKLDAQRAELAAELQSQSDKLDAGLKAQTSELATIRWVIGLGIVALGLVLTAMRLFGQGAGGPS